jgi:aminoglycoside phosphotransferase
MSSWSPQLRDSAAVPRRVDEFQRRLVLSAFPPRSRIIDERPYRPDYADYGASYTCHPMRVSVEMPGGSIVPCALNNDRFVGGLTREARLLPVLRACGLSVPQILAGPVVHPEYPQGGELLVLEELPGEPLAFVGADLDAMDCTCRLLPRAIGWLHESTEAVRASPAAEAIPTRTLLGELDEISHVGGPWLANEIFARTLEGLRPALASIVTPLVFTNGDYNVTNFLHKGDCLTGWLDFTHACFEDPHIGLSKFVVWSYDCGWVTGRRAGLVERYLYDQNVSREEYAPRLALRCLSMIQTDCSPDGDDDAHYRDYSLGILRQCMDCLGVSG